MRKLRNNRGPLQIWIMQKAATVVISIRFFVCPLSIQNKRIVRPVKFRYCGGAAEESRNTDAISNCLVQCTDIVERCYNHLEKSEMQKYTDA